MQKLRFEQSWDKTIAQKDREHIQRVFSSIDLIDDSGTHVSHLWQAQNHRGELLVTVILHNTSNTSLYFKNIRIHYIEAGKVMGEHTFSIPSLSLAKKTSMPWTFIFPKGRMSTNTLKGHGYIEIINK